MEKERNINWEIKGSIGILSIDNPPGNYLTEPEFISKETLKQWIENSKVKALLVCGVGKHFSGGARLEDLFRDAGSKSLMEEKISGGKALLDYIEHLDIPVAAVIKGICFGGGLEIALACSVRFCSENALFAFPETNHELIPGLGGIYRLREKTSFASTIKMILGGDIINAEEALQMKIVDAIRPNEEVMDYSFHFLKKITDQRPLKIINYVLKALRNAGEMSFADAMKEETKMFCDLAREEAERRKNES